MKTLVSLLLALSTGAAAASEFQDIVGQFPKCSLECIVAGAEKFDCQVTDIECQCGKMEEITAEVAPCMVNAGCGFEDITGTPPLPSLPLDRLVAVCADRKRRCREHRSGSLRWTDDW